jgi:hypothetical protein
VRIVVDGLQQPWPLETMQLNGSANKDSTPRVSLLQQFVHLPSLEAEFSKDQYSKL